MAAITASLNMSNIGILIEDPLVKFLLAMLLGTEFRPNGESLWGFL